MDTRIPGDPVRLQRMNTDELRQSYLLEGLFAPVEVRLFYVETDRAVVGSIVPTGGELALSTAKELASSFFCERREAGVLNLGGPGSISVDGKAYPMQPRDALYIGRGSREVVFRSDKAAEPAQFYLVSYPAHSTYPTTHIRQADAERVHLGAQATCNDRTIHKYIHAGGTKSCQLVMGITSLAAGSVWNTMPCHTHARRSEIYLYFDLLPDNLIVHLLGPPQETRHLILRDRQAVVSPPWSIHSACGTSNYSFVWAMGGENQEFTDMDAVAMKDLR
jgi:4-deoxy-L-threo-5-hexosulose-uronate ketol-isomerase